MVVSRFSLGIAVGILLAFFSFSAKAVDDPFLHRIHLFGGGDIGYNYLGEGLGNELGKNGYQLNAKGLASYSWTHFTLDSGAGWLYNRSEGDSGVGNLATDKITTKAGFGRIAGRYRFTPNWELGGLTRILFGADTRFATTGAESKRINVLAGIEGMYRMPWTFPVQFSLAFLTDLTISDRQVYQLLAGIQIGFPIFSWKSEPIAKEEVIPSEPPPLPPVIYEEEKEEETQTDPTILVLPAPEEPKKYVLGDLQRIQFAYNSAEVKDASGEMLKELAEFLTQYEDAWKSLHIEGHADQRGTHEYNMDLSRRRAQSVRSELIKYGVKADRLTSEGYGFTKLRTTETTEEAYRKNRRVEFAFRGIEEKDYEIFDTFFNTLNREY